MRGSGEFNAAYAEYLNPEWSDFSKGETVAIQKALVTEGFYEYENRVTDC